MAKQFIAVQFTLDPESLARLDAAVERDGEAAGRSAIMRRLIHAHLPPVAKPAPALAATPDNSVEVSV